MLKMATVDTTVISNVGHAIASGRQAVLSLKRRGVRFDMPYMYQLLRAVVDLLYI